MKTFTQFLSEAQEVTALDQMIKLIKHDCKPWLSKYKDVQLYRGIKNNEQLHSDMLRKLGTDNSSIDRLKRVPANFFKGAVRNDRRPADSPSAVHKGLNSIHTRDVGVPLRSASLFCSKNINIAHTYGTPFSILPIGEFHYAWSDIIADPYIIFNEGNIENDLRQELENIWPQISKKFKFPKTEEYSSANMFFSGMHLGMPKLDTQKVLLYALSLIPNLYNYDKGLSSCPKNHEIMLVCDKYYAVSPIVLDYL